MSKKDPPRINPMAFASAAVTQPDPVRAAIAAAERPQSAPPEEGGRKARKAGQSSRADKVQIMGWFPAQMRLTLKRIALDSGKTLEQVMAEAFTAYIASVRK